MLRTRSVLGALAMVLTASLVMAQEQPGRGRRGGFGGGGFGGMMGSPVGLLRMPEVRKELSLTEDQNKQVDEALAQSNPGRGGGAGGGGGNFQNLSQEEQQKRMEEMRKRMDEATASVKKVLTPEQNKRLDQLALQRQGASALARPEIAKDLGLSAEQKEKIETIQESSRPQFGNFRDLSDEQRQKAFAEMQEKQQKAQTEMLAVLTDEQKTKFSEMKGKEFTFPQGGPGGGGFGGRPGGPGGAGGQRERPATKPREE